MLESISWPTYLVSLFTITLAYYTWVSLTFYRTELAGSLKKRHVRENFASKAAADNGFEVIGQPAPADVTIADDQELQFGPAEADEPTAPVPSAPQQVSEFSEMVGEIKTLIRVVAESCESRENFEMLLGLIIQKYPGLSGTTYRSEIIGYLLAESKATFPFAVSEQELIQLWDEHLNH